MKDLPRSYVEKIQGIILLHLGHPNSAVNITEDELNFCINQTIKEINESWAGVRPSHTLEGKTVHLHSEIIDYLPNIKKSCNIISNNNTAIFSSDKILVNVNIDMDEYWIALGSLYLGQYIVSKKKFSRLLNSFMIAPMDDGFSEMTIASGMRDELMSEIFAMRKLI